MSKKYELIFAGSNQLKRRIADTENQINMMKNSSNWILNESNLEVYKKRLIGYKEKLKKEEDFINNATIFDIKKNISELQILLNNINESHQTGMRVDVKYQEFNIRNYNRRLIHSKELLKYKKEEIINKIISK